MSWMILHQEDNAISLNVDSGPGIEVLWAVLPSSRASLQADALRLGPPRGQGTQCA